MITEDFLAYMQFERNRSKRTVKEYREYLEAFEKFFKGLEGDLTWQTVDSDVIRDWMEDMMDRGVKASSVGTRLSAIRSFYRFALSRNLVERDPAHAIMGPKKEKSLPQFLRESEMNRLLDDYEWGDGYEDVRARTIIVTFYETGIRLAELVGLDDCSIDFGQRQLKVIGKRNKERIIPFGIELGETLKKYMTLRKQAITAQSEALFQDEQGERMKADKVRKIVQKHLRKVCTLKKCSPHVLRHTFATAMLNHDADLESVRRLLGHESVATTEIYTHTTFEQLRQVYAKAHPRSDN